MKLIIKAQTGIKTEKPWYQKLQEGFNNITIGATMAENPAVMAASGWRQNKEGKWKQDKVDNPGVQRLRSNLAEISMMSPTHPLTAVTNYAVGKALPWVFKGGSYLWNQGLVQAGKKGNQWAVNKAVSNAMSKIQNPDSYVPNNLGWAPKQTISVSNKKNTARPLTLYYPERWDVVNEGAPAHGVWFQGKWGQPRTVHTNSKPGKAEKAVKARNLFADRPVEIKGELTLDKPMQTIGDVPSRANAERIADNMGSDGLIFNNVYDNGFDNNQVIFSYKLPQKSSMTLSSEVAPSMIPNGVPSYIYNKDMDRLALTTQSGFFTPQDEYQRIIGSYNFINKGEYYNPDWTNFYENIMKPLYQGSKNPMLPRTKPKLVIHGDNNRNWNGIFDYKTDQAYVTVNGNRSTGLHEWVSHGTDKYANSKDWSNLYLEHPEKFHSDIPSANWQEQRATLNEARFNIYKELQKKLGKDNVSLDEFRSYIDTLGDRDIFNKTTRIDDSFPIKYINGYSQQYAKDMLSHDQDYFNRAVGRLRDALKNKYVQTGAMAIPLTTKKGEPK